MKEVILKRPPPRSPKTTSAPQVYTNAAKSDVCQGFVWTAIAYGQAVGRGCALARAVGLRSTREGIFSGTRLIRMDSIIVDGLSALLSGVTAGRLGRRNGPKSAERRLQAFRGGGWVMIPLTLIDTTVKTAKHGAASVEVTGRSSFEVRVAGHGPNA
jgi:hypothetical protein